MAKQSSNEDPLASLPKDVRAQLRDTYLDEAGPLIDELETALLLLERTPDDEAIIASAFRAAHTIKGSASAVGFGAIAAFTHDIENVLDALRSHRCTLQPAGLSALLGCVDVLRSFVAAARSDTSPPDVADRLAELSRTFGASASAPSSGGPEHRTAIQAGTAAGIPAGPVHDMIADLSPALRQQLQDELATGAVAYHVRFELPEDAFRRGLDPIVLLGALAEEATLYAPVPLLDRLPPLDAMNPESCYLGFQVLAVTTGSEADLSAVFEFCGDDATVGIARIDQAGQGGMAPPLSAGARPPSKLLGEILVEDDLVTPEDVEHALAKQRSQVGPAPADRPASTDDGRTIRVKQARLDGLINLVGELVTARNAMLHLEHFVEVEFGDPRLTRRLKETTSTVSKAVGQLQADVLSLRMVPVHSVFQRLPRVVRDVAVREGKQVDLNFSGETTELDKTVADALFDPLVHLVRNAVDHGLEEPAVRRAAGKNEAGRLDINAWREGNDVIVEVHDDGAGINRDRVVAAAVAKGLIDAAHAAHLTDADALELMFASGISTAREVSDISGRGVGLDAVRSRLSQIGGSVRASSVLGDGSTMRLHLPLTLNLFRALIVCVGGGVFALSLDAVRATAAIDPSICKSIQGRPVTAIQGHLCGLVSLAAVLALPGENGDSRSEPAKEWQVVVLETDGQWVGLVVDSLDPPQEIMVKPVDQYLTAGGEIVGASILGDGRVALVLEPAAVATAALNFAQLARETGSRVVAVAL